MFTFTLTDPDVGDPIEVKADSRDVLRWERTSESGERYMDLLAEMSMAKFYRLAHIAARRLKVFNGDLDEFEATYVLELEHEAVRPTSGDPSSTT